MKKIEMLKEAMSGLSDYIYMDICEKKFILNEREVSWNEDDNIEDLLEHENETYSCEVKAILDDFDGYKVVNVDNGCGESITMLFNKENEVKEI